MTAATAPGAARGRAREGASRRKEREDALMNDAAAHLNRVHPGKD